MVVTFALGACVGMGLALGLVTGGYVACDLLRRCPRCAGRVHPHPPATARQLERARRATRLRVDDVR